MPAETPPRPRETLRGADRRPKEARTHQCVTSAERFTTLNKSFIPSIISFL